MEEDKQYVTDCMNFTQFSERFKRGLITGRKGADIEREPSEGFWQRADFILEHMVDKPIFYAAPIGGVDDAFNYISALDPERAFLFARSEREVAYLGVRLCLFAAADQMSQYYLNLLNADNEEARNIWAVEDPSRLVRNVEAFEVQLGRSAVQGNHFMQALGIKNPSPSYADVLFEPEFKKAEAVRGVRRLVRTAEDENFNRTWLFPTNYKRVKEKAFAGNIRGFAAEFPHGLTQRLQELADIYGIEQLVLDLSCFDDGSARGKDRLAVTYQEMTNSVDKIFLL